MKPHRPEQTEKKQCGETKTGQEEYFKKLNCN
jgi:hypothetical protein